eukprot:TRINITY_DN2575_c0_g1_i2.p2 TRINITY_DN2575_c0_g1~~TRINITY_DN2575_c0_g1_i2.p2  ORF type:complete len:153 (+),score=33.70 TRINITY_DN2575_c0_g1_i2:456-914(+)
MKKAKSKGDEGSGDPSALVHPSGGKKKSNLEEITFREAPAIPIANIDNMKLASGVIVREGSKVRSGQKKTGEPTRMSKKEYEAALQTMSFEPVAIQRSTTQTSLPSATESRLVSKQREIVNEARRASREISSREKEEASKLSHLVSSTSIKS